MLITEEPEAMTDLQDQVVDLEEEQILADCREGLALVRPLLVDEVNEGVGGYHFLKKRC